MNAFERVAFGWQCLFESLRACRSGAVWGAWAVLFGLHALAVAACAWAAHPLLSWFMAPLLRALEGDAALRYPGLYHRLPALARDAGLVLGALALPVVAGAWTRLFERRFRGAPAAAGPAWSEALARSGSLLVAALPVTLAALGLHAALQALPGVRLSSLARALAPPAADAALLAVRIACAFAPALVVLARRPGAVALLRLPRTWGAGLVPVAVAMLLLVPVGLAGSTFVSAASTTLARRAPEWLAVASLARAGIGELLAMLATGAATLAWLGGAGEAEENA